MAPAQWHDVEEGQDPFAFIELEARELALWKNGVSTHVSG